MTCRSGMVLCAVIVGLSGLTLCQPPRPRIAQVDMPLFMTVNSTVAKDVLLTSLHAERVIKTYELDSPLVP